MRTLRLSRFHGFLLASAAVIGAVVVVSGLTTLDPERSRAGRGRGEPPRLRARSSVPTHPKE